MDDRRLINTISKDTIEGVVAGRVVSVRKMKNYFFGDVRDATGTIQLIIPAVSRIVSPDMGDIVRVSGDIVTTKSGQLSISCNGLQVLSEGSSEVANAFNKTFEKDFDVRSQRTLSLMTSEKLRNMVVARSLFIGIVRDHFRDNGFLDVDTPTLSYARFAGTAEVFETTSRSLNRALYMRGTLEDYLKQLTVAGFEKVFQIGDCFRNESPALIEFTMLEATWAYGSSEQMLQLIQQLIREICTKLPDSLVDTSASRELSQTFKVVSFWSILTDYFGTDIRTLTAKEIRKLTKSENYNFPAEVEHYDYEVAKFGYDVIKRTLSRQFTTPTFVGRFPVSISPLAKALDNDSGEADRGYGFFRGQRLFEVVAETNDFKEQLGKFEDQDIRSQRTSHSFKHDDLLTALSYGCPPMAGLGFNINRILAAILDVSRTSEVVSFPITSATLPL